MSELSSSFAANKRAAEAAAKLRVEPLHFKALPAYAAFLLKNKVREVTVEQLRLLRELNAPIIKFFEGLPEEKMIENGLERTREFLSMLSENRVSEFIELSMKEWINNQIPKVSREQIQAEDISIISYMRRSLFRNFISEYTSDPVETRIILEEADRFTTRLDKICFRYLFELQKDLYKQAQSISKTGNWIWDLEKDKLHWSDELYNIYEIDLSADNRETIRLMNHPDDVSLINEMTAFTKNTGEPHSFYYRIILPGGRIKHLLAKTAVEFDSKGVAIKLHGTLQDVTTERNTEIELKEKQNFIRKIAEITPSLITAYNLRTGKYLFVNHAITTLLGYDSGIVLSRGEAFFSEIIHPEDIFILDKAKQELAHSVLQPEAEMESIVEARYRILDSQGKYKWFHSYCTVFTRRPDGGVEEILSISNDITHEVNALNDLIKNNVELNAARDKVKEYLSNLEQKNKKLEQINKELESFTYIASHDLQEPLRKIQAFTNRLMEKESKNLSEWGLDVFDRIQNAAGRMQSLIEALLNFSRLDSIPSTFTETNFNEVFTEVTNQLSEAIDEKNAVIECEPLPTLTVSALHVQQLFLNLLTNSLKYSREGIPPEIRISSRKVAAADVPGLSQTSIPEFHHIVFSDNGIGFAEEYSEKIFELFQRLHGKNEYAGTGIGLAICKKIVENHQGVIVAEGMQGQGANFHIYFPVS